MCSLIVLRRVDVRHPLLVAANRDERRDRPASPPGLWHGERRRVLAPRDRIAGGTWLGVDDRGRFAGITNVFGEAPVDGAPSRGLLPLLALDQDDLEDSVTAVGDALRHQQHAAFQLVIADRDRIIVLRHAGGELRRIDWQEPVLAISNEHAPGLWQPRGVTPALYAGLPVGRRLEALRAVLCDRGGDGHHAVCKHGESYGTVSSSLLAVPNERLDELLWRYAPGPPDQIAYRNYGNLAARLVSG